MKSCGIARTASFASLQAWMKRQLGNCSTNAVGELKDGHRRRMPAGWNPMKRVAASYRGNCHRRRIGVLSHALPTPVPRPRATLSLILLGIDAGGTSVVAWLVVSMIPPARCNRLGRGPAGPANPHSVGWDVALRQIDTAIAAAFADAGLPRSPVAAMCIAAAGVAAGAEQQRLRDWAVDHGWAANVQVVDDAQPVLAAGTPDGWGIAVIAGTGSLVFGVDAPDG